MGLYLDGESNIVNSCDYEDKEYSQTNLSTIINKENNYLLLKGSKAITNFDGMGNFATTINYDSSLFEIVHTGNITITLKKDIQWKDLVNQKIQFTNIVTSDSGLLVSYDINFNFHSTTVGYRYGGTISQTNSRTGVVTTAKFNSWDKILYKTPSKPINFNKAVKINGFLTVKGEVK